MPNANTRNRMRTARARNTATTREMLEPRGLLPNDTSVDLDRLREGIIQAGEASYGGTRRGPGFPGTYGDKRRNTRNPGDRYFRF